MSTKTNNQIKPRYTKPHLTTSEFCDMSAKNSEICRKIYAENILFVEGMQKDRHAPAFDVGNFLW